MVCSMWLIPKTRSIAMDQSAACASAVAKDPASPYAEAALRKMLGQ